MSPAEPGQPTGPRVTAVSVAQPRSFGVYPMVVATGNTGGLGPDDSITGKPSGQEGQFRDTEHSGCFSLGHMSWRASAPPLALLAVPGPSEQVGFWASLPFGPEVSPLLSLMSDPGS